MANKSGEGFLLTTNFYKSKNYATILVPKKLIKEGKAAINPEGMDINKQENNTTKQIVLWKIYANKIHTKLDHPG